MSLYPGFREAERRCQRLLDLLTSSGKGNVRPDWAYADEDVRICVRLGRLLSQLGFYGKDDFELACSELSVACGSHTYRSPKTGRRFPARRPDWMRARRLLVEIFGVSDPKDLPGNDEWEAEESAALADAR